MSTSTSQATLAQATILQQLKKLGYSDERDNIARQNSAENMDSHEQDLFFQTIQDLGLTNKDILFLGSIPQLQMFTKLLRPVRSIEVVKFESDVTSGRKQSDADGKKHRSNSDSCDSPRLAKISISARENSKDVIALNCVSNRLDTGALSTLTSQALEALRPEGHFVMREYLDGPSGGSISDRYFFRDPSTTCSMMNTVVSSDGNDGFQLVFAFTPEADRVKGTQEITWVYRKVGANSPGKKLQEFLDEQQYSIKGILKYEKIFGYRYVSTGGERTTTEFCQLLDLQPGQKVLDVGCGIGGSAFYMAKEYGVHVHGMDLSSNMISIAIDRRREGDYRGVDFEIANVLTRDYPAESFDLIYSRDVILHIEDKKKLFTDIFKWLKPGGKLFVTDYCCGEKTHSEDFKQYVKQRGYILLTVQDYGRLLSDIGFVNVKAEDRTKQFISILHAELNKFVPQQAEFLEEFSEENYNEIVDGWNAKTKRCNAGDQAWGLFLATKPL